MAKIKRVDVSVTLGNWAGPQGWWTVESRDDGQVCVRRACDGQVAFIVSAGVVFYWDREFRELAGRFGVCELDLVDRIR